MKPILLFLVRRSAISQLFAFGWKYRRRVAGLLVLQLLLLATSVLILQLGGFAIDWIRYRNNLTTETPFIYGWNPSDSGRSAAHEAVLISFLIAATACIRALLNYAYAISNGLFINKEMVVDLRIETFRKLQILDFEYFNRNTPSSLLNRLTGDIQLARSFIDGVVIQILVLVMSLGFYLVAMLQLHVGLTLAALATIPLMVWQTISFSQKTRPQYDRNRELSDNLMRCAQENIEGQMAVKSFGRQSDEVERFRIATNKIETQQRSIFWKVSTYTPIVQLLTQAGLVILLLYGGYLVITDQLALGSGLVVFAGLLQQFSNQVNAITSIANTVEQSLAGARRVFEVLDAPVVINQDLLQHEQQSKTRKTTIPEQTVAPISGCYRLHKVSYSYRRDEMVLHDISLNIPAQACTAIVGQVGSGKSTLLHLLPRFYEPVHGKIELDGQLLNAFDLVKLRRSIGVVFQEASAFSTSIFSNIAYGKPDATMQQVIAAAKSAAIHEFIVGLPNGYETVLGESGYTLSGGQRQRLSLARALLIDPAILILDDPTSAVDVQTELAILNNLREIGRHRTLIVATNRTNILARADLVHFLQQGRLVASGTHTELLANCRDYQQLLAMENETIA